MPYKKVILLYLRITCQFLFRDYIDILIKYQNKPEMRCLRRHWVVVLLSSDKHAIDSITKCR